MGASLLEYGRMQRVHRSQSYEYVCLLPFDPLPPNTHIHTQCIRLASECTPPAESNVSECGMIFAQEAKGDVMGTCNIKFEK